MARSSACTEQYAHKVFDRGDIVRDAIYRQLTPDAKHQNEDKKGKCRRLSGAPTNIEVSIHGADSLRVRPFVCGLFAGVQDIGNR